jgi:mannose-1-phosphate guanylyltransferase
LKAVILAGGFGKRLKPFTDDRPKAMLEIAGFPILVWQIDWLRRNEITDVVICVGHLHEVVSKYIGSGKNFGVNVEYSVEEEPLGTAGALRNASSLLQDECFFMTNGDTITDLDPWRLKNDVTEGYLGSIAAIPLQSPYGIIEIEGRLAKGFREKPLLPGYWINAGVYCLSTAVLDMLPELGNIESTTLPQLARDGKLRVTKFESVNWKSIDTHKDIEEAQRQFEKLVPSFAKDQSTSGLGHVAR